MLKLEKIIILFNLFYKVKSLKFFNFLYSNFKNKKICTPSCYRGSLLKLWHSPTILQISFFFIASVLKNIIFKNKLYLCFKLHLRITIVSIYFKKTLLFTIFKSLKKRIRTKKRLESLYKEKGLVYGVKKIRRWNKWIYKKKLRKKKNIKRIRKSLFKFIFKSFLKFIDVFRINSVFVYFFKSNRNIKWRGIKRVYQRRRNRFYRYKIIKKIKKLFFLNFPKNLKFKIKLSNNFSHSKKFLKLKKKRT